MALHSRDNFLLPVSPGDTKIFIQDINGNITFSFNPWRVTSIYYKRESQFVKLKGTDNPLIIKFRTPKESLEALTMLQESLDLLKNKIKDIPKEVIDYVDTKILESINNNHFSFNQQSPSDTWIVEHELSKRGSVTVTNDNLESIIGLIKYINDDIVHILFNEPLTGWVFVN